MTQKDLIKKVAKMLEWSESKTYEAVKAIVELLTDKISDSKNVSLDDFGNFNITKKSEYISLNIDTGDRYLMPPMVSIDFEPLNIDDLSDIFFEPDEALSRSINSAFQNFEPTLLKEGIDLEGVEVIAEGSDEEPEPEDNEIDDDVLEILHAPDIGPVPVTSLRPGRRVKRNRKSTIMIPILGGAIIALASLFFFKGVSGEETRSNFKK